MECSWNHKYFGSLTLQETRSVKNRIPFLMNFLFSVNVVMQSHKQYCMDSFCGRKVMWILISWLHQKPADLDQHVLLDI